MLKASAESRDGRNLVVLGLSQNNVDRLVAGEPILMDLAEFGADTRLLIFAGSTEEQMTEEFRSMLGPSTQVEMDPRLFGRRGEAEQRIAKGKPTS